MLKYGAETEINEIDDLGSTLKVKTHYKEYKAVKKEKRYDIRVKVNSRQQELAEYMRFSDEIADNKERKDISFCIEYPKKDTDGTYFVIKGYTVVDTYQV